MNWSTWRRIFVGCVGLVGCGGEPSAEQAQSALAGSYYQTVPGHNKAETTDTYSCAGWTYRMLFSWEQHLDPASPTGWYAAIGPSSVATTGIILNDVSADVYLQCYWGILPSDPAIDASGRIVTGRLFQDRTTNPIPCSLTTVWPASWNLPNPVTPVSLLAYDYVPDSMNGTIYLALSSTVAPGDPGSGWCGGDSWTSAHVTTGDKFNIPAAPGDPCRAGYGWDGQRCVVLPPCDAPGADQTRCISFPPSPPAP